MLDYAHPTLMAEIHLKELHQAMLKNKPDEALQAGLQAIVEIRLALAAIKCVNQR